MNTQYISLLQSGSMSDVWNLHTKNSNGWVKKVTSLAGRRTDEGYNLVGYSFKYGVQICQIRMEGGSASW